MVDRVIVKVIRKKRGKGGNRDIFHRSPGKGRTAPAERKRKGGRQEKKAC